MSKDYLYQFHFKISTLEFFEINYFHCKHAQKMHQCPRFHLKHKKLTILRSTFHYFKKGISEFCNSQKNMSVNETKSDSPLLILFLHTVKPDFAI